MRALPLVLLDLFSGTFPIVPVLFRALARVPSDFGRWIRVRGADRASSSSLESDGVRAAAGGVSSLSWATIAFDGFVSCEEVRHSLVAESAELEDANRARRSGSSPPRLLGVMGKARSDMAVAVVFQRHHGMSSERESRGGC